MTEPTSEIELEMERQEADAEQDLLDRMADAFDRAEKGAEVEAIWAVRDEYLERLRAERDDMAQGAAMLVKLARNRADQFEAERDALKAVVARAERLRDKWLTYPTDDMHYAAGLMLARHLSGEAFTVEETNDG